MVILYLEQSERNVINMFEKLPLILDCACGTEMQKQGFTSDECLEKWILENPEPLKSLQRDCIAAGSVLVYAPTFGANRMALKKHGLDSSVRDYNLRLAELSLSAADGKALVGGDIAPTGGALEPYGDMERDELLDIFREQAKSLEEAGVDIFGVETQLSGDEALAAVEAIKSVSKKPIFVSFTCNDSGRTFYGDKFGELAAKMESVGVSAFGLNCVGDFELLKRLVSEIHSACALPIIAKPNAGIPENVNGTLKYALTPEAFAKGMTELKELGASLLGGCCGTGVEHISALVKALG